LNQLGELKSILHEEIQNLMKNHAQEGNNATDRLLSRHADRNDIIRINTIEWVLKIIAKLEINRQAPLR
jgi:hypothetical protein